MTCHRRKYIQVEMVLRYLVARAQLHVHASGHKSSKGAWHHLEVGSREINKLLADIVEAEVPFLE